MRSENEWIDFERISGKCNGYLLWDLIDLNEEEVLVTISTCIVYRHQQALGIKN